MYSNRQEMQWRSHKEKTFEELDAEVEEALRQERQDRVRRIIIGILVLFLFIPDAFLFWFRFATPRFAVEKSDKVIDVNKSPVQEHIVNDKTPIIRYKTLENRGEYDLHKVAKYSIRGKVVAKNYYFWGNYLPWGDRPLQSVSLFDLGLVWGDLADRDILEYYKFVSAKDLTSRSLYPRLKWGVKYAPYSWNEIKGQYSHTHIVPASANIMYALIFLRRNQAGELKGYLVDIYNGKNLVGMTSVSREDTNQTSRGYMRGGGACEILYVEEVQVKNKIYR